VKRVAVVALLIGFVILVRWSLSQRFAKLHKLPTAISTTEHTDPQKSAGSGVDLKMTADDYYGLLEEPELPESRYRATALGHRQDTQAAYLLAISLERKARSEEAIDWFRRSITARPENPAPHLRLALTYLDIGQFRPAGAEIRRLGDLKQFGWATWIESLYLFSRHNVRGALQELSKLDNLTDTAWRSRTYSARACWLAEAGETRRALNELNAGFMFDMAHGLMQPQVHKLVQLAWLYLRERDLPACLDARRRAYLLGLDTNRVATIGIIEAQAGDAQQARSMLAVVNSRSSKNADFYVQRLSGEIALSEGDKPSAISHFRAAAAIAPAIIPRDYLARALLSAGKFQEAIEIYRMLVSHPVRLYPDPESASPGFWSDLKTALQTATERSYLKRP
jgi:tetratricopeptide (TPR) repeat protein